LRLDGRTRRRKLHIQCPVPLVYALIAQKRA
jgi:hypothetical protein